MTIWDAFGCIMLFVGLSGMVAYLLGHSLIDAFFKRKEEIINRLTWKGDV